jgi:signal transduction histidine kinase
MNTSPLRFIGNSVSRDMALVAAAAVLAAWLAARFQLLELMFDVTRRFERLQLDEWPSVILVFALCMVVLYARRHAQLRNALAENRHLVRRLMEVQEDERRWLTRELHDELGQTLTAIRFDVLALPQTAAARRVADNVDRVFAAAGNLVRRLTPTALEDLGLPAALEVCVARWRVTHPRLVVQLSMNSGTESLGQTVELALYRIVQEALTNCVRHAGARHFNIALRRDVRERGDLVLELRDDGAGLQVDGVRPLGCGLAGMRERAAMLGGRMDLLSEPGRGVTIRVEIPARQEG